METVENRQCIGDGAVRPACSLALPLVTPAVGGLRFLEWALAVSLLAIGLCLSGFKVFLAALTLGQPSHASWFVPWAPRMASQ